MAVAIGATASLQLYPYVDNYHIAFIVPILILVLLSLKFELCRTGHLKLVTSFLMLSMIPALLISFQHTASVQRTGFESRELQGMQGSWLTARSLDETMKHLSRYAKPGEVRFLCSDGIYAGASGRYLSIDEKFVTWGPEASHSTNPSQLFVCYADTGLYNSLKSQGWKPIFKVLWRPIVGYQDKPYWNVLFQR